MSCLILTKSYEAHAIILLVLLRKNLQFREVTQLVSIWGESQTQFFLIPEFYHSIHSPMLPLRDKIVLRWNWKLTEWHVIYKVSQGPSYHKISLPITSLPCYLKSPTLESFLWTKKLPIGASGLDVCVLSKYITYSHISMELWITQLVRYHPAVSRALKEKDTSQVHFNGKRSGHLPSVCASSAIYI